MVGACLFWFRCLFAWVFGGLLGWWILVCGTWFSGSSMCLVDFGDFGLRICGFMGTYDCV